jgi:hypothetical protein
MRRKIMHRLSFWLALALCAAPAVARADRCPAPARPVAAEQMTAYVGFLRQAADMMKQNDDEGFADSAEQVQWRDGWLGYLCSDAKAITEWREQNDMQLQASPGCLDIFELACAMDRDTMIDDFHDAAVVVEACNADLDAAVKARTEECLAPEPTQDLPDTAGFTEPLAPYGTWVETEAYGQVWYPSAEVVGPGWQPFHRGGHWVHTVRGWTWVSDYPWGWGPFHYGRWGWDGIRHAWFWQPGRIWMPATAEFRYTDDAIGWAPLPLAGAPAWPLDDWVYVPPAQVYNPAWTGFVITGPRVALLHGRARVVDVRVGVTIRRGALFGPPIRIVQRAGVTVRPVPVRTVVRVGPPPRVAVRVTTLPSGRFRVAARPTVGVLRPAIARPAPVHAAPARVAVPPRPVGAVARPPLRAPAPPPPAARVPRRPVVPTARPGVPPAPRPGPLPAPGPRPGVAPAPRPAPLPAPGVRPAAPPPRPALPPRPVSPQPRPAFQPRPAPQRPAVVPRPAPHPRPAARPAPSAPRPSARPAPRISAPRPAARPAPRPSAPAARGRKR